MNWKLNWRISWTGWSRGCSCSIVEGIESASFKGKKQVQSHTFWRNKHLRLHSKHTNGRRAHEDRQIRDVATSVSYLSGKVSYQASHLTSRLTFYLYQKFVFFLMCILWSLLFSSLGYNNELIKCICLLQYLATYAFLLSIYDVYVLNISEVTH